MVTPIMVLIPANNRKTHIAQAA
uniref:Uncharacterized protein n=1 Tax=Anguilla anguilla TaxID=7936 RepID=A0A0E9UZ09_ANGAN